MQASWSQWGGAVNSGVNNYHNYPAAVSSAVGNFSSLPSSNPFPIPATSAMNAPAATPAAPSQYPMYGQQSQQQQQQQQWQQWEQWQQQYAQWHQQYGDKYQGPVPTPAVMPSGTSFSSVPPLPQCAPTVQPPPPNSVPPPSDKNGDNNKRPLSDSSGKEETKKLKLGKGSKSENVDDLIEQEKTFDAQFKSWEASFLKWKDQNANHPDKTQYKEYEAKWESWREQLLQKREQLRKKREAKEAEVAAAAAAAKEAALATSNVSNLQQPNYNSNMMNPSNPYPPMYSMPSVYPPQDMMSNQSTANFMSNFSMYNVPPPPNMPAMPGIHPVGQDSQNVMKLGDGPKTTQSLEFLSSTSSKTKSIPGLDLASTDKNMNPAMVSNIPSNSSLFSYNQDVTKPLHTSDDKPFNFPTPSQSNFSNDHQTQYGRGRPLGNSFDQFSRGPRFSQFDGPPPRLNQPDRSTSFDDRFGNGNFNRDHDSRLNNDFNFSGRNTDFRNEPPDKGLNKFSSTSFTPNFSADKFAKYLEDEYDDSRFRDPEPSHESSQFNNKSNYRNRDGNFTGNRQNFGRSDNSYNFNDRSRGNFDRNKSAPFDRNKPDGRFESFGRDMKSNQFSRGSYENAKDGFGRGDYGRVGNDSKSTMTNDKIELNRPVSLLDLPLMKPPETFDKMKTPSEKSDISSQPGDSFNSYSSINNRFSHSKNESDQNFYSDRESIKPLLNTKSTFPSSTTSDLSKSNDSTDSTPPEVVKNYVPCKIYEYDHISRNENNGVCGTFEPVYVFDYSHGKKKVNDFTQEIVAPFIDLNKQSKVEEHSWEGESWDENEKSEESVPLPPRNRNSFPQPVIADSESLLKNTPENKEYLIAKNGSIKNDSVITQPLSDKIEEKRWTNDGRKDADMFANEFEEKHSVKLINDLLYPPGRISRPSKLVIIMRGAPGSGKTYTAKLIKDKEIEMGGNAPRILSLDDYFTVENDVESTDPTTGKISSKKEMQYEYDAALELSYQESLLKSFKKTISDGFFPFIIVDCVNEKLKKYEEMYNFAKLKGFQVFICEMDQDIAVCSERNIHNRSENEISKIINEWEKTPVTHTLLDFRSLLQSADSATLSEVDMTAVEESSKNIETTQSDVQNRSEEEESSNTEEKTENIMEEEETDSKNKGLASYMEVFCTSKWEKMENTEEKLDQLDGVRKKRSSTSFKEWLQLPEESESDLSWYTSNAKTSGESSVSRKKRVRWADLEERVAQQKMRTLGFVVGQTDWKRMMDPSFGGSKLTETKYFYK